MSNKMLALTSSTVVGSTTIQPGSMASSWKFAKRMKSYVIQQLDHSSSSSLEGKVVRASLLLLGAFASSCAQPLNDDPISELRVYLSADAVADIRTHVESGFECGHWFGNDAIPSVGQDTPPVKDEKMNPRLVAFSSAQWRRACSIEVGNKRINSREVCHSPDGIVVTAPKLLALVDENACVEILTKYVWGRETRRGPGV